MKIRILLAFYLLLLGTTGWAQFNPQPRVMTEKFFPEKEITVKTPAFENGSSFTSNATMQNWLEMKKQQFSNLVTINNIGKSQAGKTIIQVILTNPASKEPKIKVWLQGGLHGDEPAGTESLLYVIDQLLSKSEYQKWLDKLEISIVPMANIDGYERLRRESLNGTDLNRDQTKLSAPESKSLKEAFSKFQAQVAMDVHEYRPFRKDFSRFSTRGISSIYDVMFLYSGNLNVPQNLREYTKTAFVNTAKKAVEEAGYRTSDYLTTQKYGGKVQFNLGSIHSRSSATSYALTNAISTLIEIRGVGLYRTSFKRRIDCGSKVVLSYLQSAFENGDAIRSELAKALEASQKQEVVVTSRRKLYKDSLEVVDIATNTEIKVPATIHSALQSRPLIVRKRPTAYVLLRSETRAAMNLALLGLNVEVLQSDIELEVEVESYFLKEQDEESASDEEDEEANAGATKGEEKLIKFTFPRGCYICYTDQKNGNLACEVLEPENPNGFLATKVIKAKDQSVLPVYRYLNPQKIVH